MNQLIYYLLWGGVVLSLAVILIGLFAKLLSPAGFPRAPTPVSLLALQVFQLTPAGLLSLGVLLMIFTPFARVLLTIFIFAEERDRTYVFVTGLVFANLMLGVLLSLLFGVG
jgi:uncharacterized membrane protein